MFHPITFIVFLFWIWCLQHVKKLGQENVKLCVTSLCLLTKLRQLGREDTNCWCFESGILSHSYLMYNFSCSTVCGVHFCILHFIIYHTFLTGAGLYCRQADVRLTECDFIVLLEWSRDVSEKDVWIAASVVPNLYIPFRITVSSQMCKLHMPSATTMTWTPCMWWLLDFAPVTLSVWSHNIHDLLRPKGSFLLCFSRFTESTVGIMGCRWWNIVI